MSKFIISIDSSADGFKTDLAKKGVHAIVMKRVLNGEEISQHFDNKAESDAFYESIKKGALPTTTAVNAFEHLDHWRKIMEVEKSGDIIHLSLSSGLSVTYNNAVTASEEFNAELEKSNDKRRVFVVDSLVATCGMDHMIDELVAMRDAGKSAEEAVKRIEELRNNQQGWVIVNDLFHLKRGGRISGVKATIGTILNIKPIITINRKGKLAIEGKAHGGTKAVAYLLNKVREHGEKANPNFTKQPFYIAMSGVSPIGEEFKSVLKSTYPDLDVRESLVSPIIGSHVGNGAIVVVWEGSERLNID